MIRKIIPIAAIALAIGMLTDAPRVATAAPLTSSVTVTAVIPTSATVTTTPANLNSWTTSSYTTTFTVTVTTSDTNGYNFNFYDSSSGNVGPSSFVVTGKASGTKATFAIGTTTPSFVYQNTVNPQSGSPTYTTSGSPTTITCQFNSTPPTVADTYTDTVTVAVNLE